MSSRVEARTLEVGDARCGVIKIGGLGDVDPDWQCILLASSPERCYTFHK